MRKHLPLLLVVVLLLAGCQALGGLARDIGLASTGEEVGGPGPDTTGERIVEAAKGAEPFLPFPVREGIAALFSGLAVYAYATKRKETR